jgi:S-adenosyl-L-methionine hydrolase (adenosine-forming)
MIERVDAPSSGRTEATGPATRPAVFFVSDYGTVDEFVGVVHAVLHRLAPTVPVIDLSHHVPAFDVAAGAALLVRSGSHLGAGVVLAVVDPGVGTDRRGVALEVPGGGGPNWLVGPDNGLLVPLAESLGGVRTVIALGPSRTATRSSPGTFDGRDVFAPAAAHLATGGPAARLGTPVGVATLVTEFEDRPGRTVRSPSGPVGPTASEVVATVTWIDGYGNTQLDLTPASLSGVGLRPGAPVRITVGLLPLDGGPTDGATGAGGADRGSRVLTGRWVEAFGQLNRGELGIMEDANGRMTLVLDRASAARELRVASPGAVVHIGALPGGPG